MFRTVHLYIIRSFSLYTQQWYMSHRFADSILSENLFYIYHCCTITWTSNLLLWITKRYVCLYYWYSSAYVYWHTLKCTSNCKWLDFISWLKLFDCSKVAPELLAESWLLQLLSSLSKRRPRFSLRILCLGFGVCDGQCDTGTGFHRVLRFYPVSFIPAILHTFSLICQRHYTNVATHWVVNYNT